MHPVEVDSEVVIASSALARAFRHVPMSRLFLDVPVGHPMRRGQIDGWVYCPDLGEHEYDVAIKVDPNSDFFTETEKAYGYKVIKVLQRHIISKA